MEFSTAGVVFLVYLMNQVDTWINGSKIALFILSLSVVFWAFGTALNCDLHAKKFTDSMFVKHFRKAAILLFALLLVSSCTPNKETVMQMGVAYGASEVIKSDTAAKVAQEISQISGKTAKVVNNKLDKMLEEK